MKREFRAGMLRVYVCDNRAEMGEAAAALVVERMKSLLREKNRINMVFAAAPSQNEVLAALLKADIDWTRVNAFHMDEYVGLPAGAPQSFGEFLREKLFGRLPFANVFYIDGNSASMEGECERYSGLLRSFPPDIVCLGIGENGHLAFNDPPVADFRDQALVKPVWLDEVCRQQQVNDGCFGKLGEVPRQAITLTIPALLQAAYIVGAVPGPAKARAIFNTVHQPVVPAFPSTILRTHRNAVLFVDQQAAALLDASAGDSTLAAGAGNSQNPDT